MKKSPALAMALTLILSLTLTAFASAAAEGADRAFAIENLYAVEYDGNYQKPKPVVLNGSGIVLSEGPDYTLTYSDNRNAGTATITVTGRGDYGAVTVNGEKLPAVTATAQFEITPRDLYVTVDSVTVRAGEQPKFSYSLTSGTLAGSDKLPTPSYRLHERTDTTRSITVDFGGDVSTNYRIHITDGILTYAGSDEIEPEGSVTVSKLSSVTYNGKAQTPEPTLTAANGATLRRDVDYTLTYRNNINAGTATVTVTGKGSYAGTLDKTLTFEIKPAPITVKADTVRCRINNEPDEFDYSISSGKVYGNDDIGNVTIKKVSRSGYSYGPVFDLKVTVKNRNANYDITTKNGTMTYTDVDGDDAYYRYSDSEGLRIQKIVTADYDGTYQEPEVTVKDNDGDVLREGTDYRLTYSDNLHAGTATVTAIGKGSHSGERDSRTFTIRKRDVTVTVNDAVVTKGETYTGTYTVYPRLCSGDSLGKESWSNTDTSRLGTYTVNVSFAGNKDYDITVKSGKLTVVEAQPSKTALGTPRKIDTSIRIQNPYQDIASGKWYEEPALFCRQNGILFGTSEDTFTAGGHITRAQLVTALYRLNGSPRVYGTTSFLDVAYSSWYEDAVTWATQNDIVTGYDEYRFGPNDDVTREQFVTILYRYALKNGFSVSQSAKLSAYTDETKIASYAREATSWAIGARVLTFRVSGEIQPDVVANRAELAISLQRFCTTYLN